MNFSKITTWLQTLAQRGRQVYQFLDRRSHGWLALIIGAVNDALNAQAMITSAAIAYYAFFSLFPLILLSLFIASFNLTAIIGQASIISRLEFIAPDLSLLLGQNIDHIIRARGPITIIALAGLIWSSSGIFYTLTQTMNDIWGYKRNRPYWKRRGLAILFGVAFAGPLIVLASIGSSLVANLRALIPPQIFPLGVALSLLTSILLDIVLFLMLYFFLPHRASRWYELLPGAIGAGLLWEAAKKLFLLFVTRYITASNLIYGSVATVIAFLTWAYLSGHIFLFGAYFNLAFVQRKEENH